MRFASTRHSTPNVTLSQAIDEGLAPDGGLYVPEALPRFGPRDFDGRETLPDIAERLLAPFVEGDELAPRLGEIAREAFDFPAPSRSFVREGAEFSALELFHGPTAAFKDFGARFLAACLSRQRERETRGTTLLVATSGDTGGAVAAAFHRKPFTRVVVLFPRGLVTERQERQLCAFGENVHTLAVTGTFDDCQRMVKQALADDVLREQCGLSSANSINIGRLLPQIVYYAASSLACLRATGERPGYIIPSGNLGNATACAWGRAMGLPIGPIVLAHNENRAIPDFLETGHFRPRPSVPTLASAMDVGNPSNLERLLFLHPDARSLGAELAARSISDERIRARIRDDHLAFGAIWCPHTATAAEVHACMPQREQRETRWNLVATAHPAKFESIVEPLIGASVPVPAPLAALLTEPPRREEIAPTLESLRTVLMSSLPPPG